MFRNIDLKRRIARLCLFLTIFAFLVNSLIAGVVEVEADSNDRRQTYISLAKGKSATEMEEIKDMSAEELRCIALYLTNFYKTWNTRLNLEAAKNSGESINDEYDSVIEMMTKALSDYCGFDKDTAKYIASLCMQYNVGTRQQLYIKKEHLRMLYIINSLSNTRGGQFSMNQTITNSDGTTTSVPLFDTIDNFKLNTDFYANRKVCGLGFMGAAYFYNPSVFDYDSDQGAKSVIGINNFENYCNSFGEEVITIDGITYIPLTYPMFMTAMDLSYRVSCLDTVTEKQIIQLGLNTPDVDKFLSNSKWTEDYYIRRPDLHNDILSITGSSRTVIASSYTNIVSFYWNNSGTMIPAFSTSNECMKMYALINDDIDYENGYGSSFLACTPSEVVSLLNKTDAIGLTALGQRMYTNWVGDLLVDNKADLYTIFPGCANPYMLTRITDIDPNTGEESSNNKVVQGNRLNFLNVHTLINSHKIAQSKNKGDEDLYVTYAVDSDGNTKNEEHTLWEQYYYTHGIGSNKTNWDEAWAGSFGDTNDKIFNALENSGYINFKSSAGDDSILFPSWTHIHRSASLTGYGYSGAGEKNGLDRIGNSTSYVAKEADKFLWIKIEDDEYNRSAYLAGISRANDTVIVYDNIKGYKQNQDLSEFFQTGNILVSQNKFTSITSNKYSSINDTKLGYAQNTKAFFQPLFLTYCFAYFNRNAESFNKSNNVINLKMQSAYFPSGDSTIIDWSGIEVSKDETANEVLSFVYYLLHPVEGIKYVATWLKNKIGGIFIGWHEDIVGSSDSNSSLGMTQYLGFSGYVTTPNLSDIGWIDAIMNNYTSIVVYVLIFMAIIMLMYIIVGQITVQRAIVGFILFGFCALLPPVFINTTISVINKTCDTIYSSKFDYWAIVQTEEYLGRLQSYKDAQNGKGTDEDILASILAVNNNVGGIENETGYSGMRVKWISPKKFNDMAELTEAMDKAKLDDEGGILQSIVINSVAATTSGETYLGSDNALYLYRDILDIYRYGAMSYNIYNPSNNGGITDKSFVGANIGDFSNYKISSPDDSIFYKYWLYKNAGTNSSGVGTCNSINTFNNVWKPTNNQVPHLSTIYDSNNLNVDYSTTDSSKSIKVTYNKTDYTGLYFRLASNLDGNTATKDIKFLTDTSSLSALKNGFINNKFNNVLISDVKNYYTTDNLATTLLATYSGTYRTIGMHRLGYLAATQEHTTKSYSDYIALNDSAMSGGTTNTENFTKFANNYVFAEFPKGFNFSLQALQGAIDGTYSVDFNQLSHFYYGLYSESPYYFMNYEFRDVLKADGYIYDPSYLVDRGNSGASVNDVVNMFLKDKQAYFYNYVDGDGYGELKDFMNMHDFFYYVLPAMKTGVEIVHDFDEDFGFYTYDTCPLRIQPDGSFKYNGVKIINSDGSWTSTTSPQEFWDELTQQQRYEFWHDLNVNLLCYNYCSWLDTMYDCSYAEPESISVLGEKFLVTDPLDPMTYFQLDDSNNVIAGRYMVFSRSEMEYYGLKMSDLTQVEKKIIDMQDAVYKEAISLTNYYNLSNETLIHNYSLLQLFEFNKAFSEDSFLGESYTLYPQGYELKATSYDGYLRLILSGSTGEDLMTDPGDSGNTSIYERIMKKTSIFFGLMLIANDFIAVYAIPALKLFFLIIIFFISILIIIASALKVELNIINVLWKSLISPCIFYAGVSIGLAWIVSLFMSNGSVGVTQDSILIQLGDPTMTILVMLIINIVALILYWKICKKCFADFKKYITAIYHDMFGAVAGTFGKIVGGITSGRYDKNSSGGFSTPKQRGEGNNPKSGKSGVASALVAGGVAGAVAGDAASDSSEDAKKTKYNALADKSNDKISKLEEKQQKHTAEHFKDVNAEQKNLDIKRANAKDRLDSAKAEHDCNIAQVKADKSAENEARSRFKAAEKNKADNKTEVTSSRRALIDAKKKSSESQDLVNKSGGKLKQAKNNLNTLASRQSALDAKRNSLANDEKYKAKQARYNKKINKAKAKQAGLNAKGINRYKVAATAGMGAKALAKVSGKALKNSAKFAGKTAVNTAKAAGHMAVDATKAVGNAAVTTTKATINALADNIVDSSK